MGALILTNLSFLTNAWSQSTGYSFNTETDKLIEVSMAANGTVTGVDSFTLTYSSTTLSDVGASAYYDDTLWFINVEKLYYVESNSTTVEQYSSSEIDVNIAEDPDIYNGMSFDASGNLWVVNADDAISATGIFLSVINRSTGLIDGDLTPGGTDIIEVTGIAEGTVTSMKFDPLTNDLYLGVQNGGMSLYKVNLIPGTNWTAEAELVGKMGDLGIEGLTFNSSGQMFGSTNEGEIYLIDPNSALWFPVTTTSVNGDLTTISFQNLPINYIGISGYVFNDANLSAIFEADETGGNNITVTLYLDDNGNGVLDGNEDSIVASVNTNYNGFYDFRIPFAASDEYIIVSDVNDYPINTNYEVFQLAIDPTAGSAGDYYDENNFSYHYGLLITGRVYEDVNKDSVMQGSEDVNQDSLIGIVVELYDDDNCDGVANTGGWLDTVQVDETGEFVFTTQYGGDATSNNAGKTTKLVSGPTDDAVEDGGLVFFNADSINIGDQIAAFRFKNIGLKVGDVVVDAHVKFIAAGNSSGIVQTKIACELETNAGAVKTGQTSDLSNRKSNLTTATTWVINEDWTDGEAYYTPNIASAFQEVIGLPGYGGQSSFLLFFLDEDQNGRWIRTKDYNGAPYAPELTMEWTDGTGSDCFVLKVNVDGKVPTPTVTEGGAGYALSFTSSIDTILRYFGVWGAAVPVTWLDFQANKLGSDASVLNWSTSQEMNNDFFTVQHSTDGVHFTDIGIVKGAGNSTSAKHYEYIHADPIMGVNYYRIKQTDFNGTWDYSVIRTVNFGGPVGEVTVSPNPVKGIVTVQIPENVIGETTVSVINMTGKVVMTKTVTETELNNGSAMIDVSSVKPGAYLITVESLNEVYSSRIIKN